MKKIAKVVEAGGKVDYLSLDHPVRRLMSPDSGAKGFDSFEKAVDQLVIYMKTVRATYPDIQFFDISNFPNWGYRGGISYHALGLNRQEWGDYFDVLQLLIRKSREAGVSISGVSVDNPYDYATGRTKSHSLADPTQVNWMKRIVDLEKYVEGEGLEFNLMINCETAGGASDEEYYHDTLAFLDAYRAAGGSPKRYLVQSWYKHPVAVVPETAPFTMTALTKEVIERVKGGGKEETK
jgi:hypothetical protein